MAFYYPVAVGGHIARILDDFIDAFSRDHPAIRIVPTYVGNYQEALVAVVNAHKSGTPPALFVLLSTDMFSLIDEGVILPYDSLIEGEEDRAWLNGFYPAFMLNSRSELLTWGVPFQRSTMVLYWNKEMFDQAGLDPSRGPASWTEHVVMADKLTRRGRSGSVLQWGTQVPTTAFAYWSLQALSLQSGALLANLDGNRTFFDDPAVIESLTHLVDLSQKHKVMAPGRLDWSSTPRDFLDRKIAMMWTTTGNLTYIRDNARFAFGVGMLPGNRRRGAPTGGGNLYLSRNVDRRTQEAAATFARWITQTRQAAQWSIATGYVAVTPSAYRTEPMTEHLSRFPSARVARDQLANAGSELSTHDNQRVTQLLDHGIGAALMLTRTPERALREAQMEADRVLRRFR